MLLENWPAGVELELAKSEVCCLVLKRPGVPVLTEKGLKDVGEFGP